MIQIFHGDCREVLKKFYPILDLVDSVVTDPPYGLSFMGKGWDHGVPGVEFWKIIGESMKPGAHLLAFGGTRTFHRLACAIEDAGFEIRDCVMWVYGTGFPKSLDVSKAIDKARKKDPAVLYITRMIAESARAKGIWRKEINTAVIGSENDAGSAQSWTTLSYEGAHQPRVPTWEQWLKLKTLLGLTDEQDLEIWRLNGLKGQPGENWFRREVVGEHKGDMGGLGGQRLGQLGGDITTAATDAAKQWDGWGTALKPAWEPIILARKPLEGTVAANVLEHGVGGLNVDACRVGTSKEIPASPSQHEDTRTHGKYGPEDGTASGFNPNIGRWPANLIHNGSEEVVGLFPSARSSKGGGRRSGSGLGYMGAPADGGQSQQYHDSGSAARFFYCAKASKNDRGEGNDHPTVKPTDLMRYLCRLVTPPGGTILDPFMGSGSTGRAAIQEGFGFVGIDENEHYYEIARKRLNEIRDPLR